MVLLHSGGVAQEIKLSRRCLFNLDVCRKGKLELGWRAKTQESRVPKKAKSRSELTFWELLYLHEECGSSCETKAALVIDAVRRARACGFTGNQLNH